MSLSKLRSRHNAPSFDDDFGDLKPTGPNQVSYLSVQKSSATGTLSFAAVTPANSRHAAKLTEIALAVQSQQTRARSPTPPRNMLLSTIPGRRLQIRDKDTAGVDDYYAPPPTTSSEHQNYQTQSGYQPAPYQRPCYPPQQPAEATVVTYHKLPDGSLVPVSTPYRPAPLQDQGQEVSYYSPANSSNDFDVPEATRIQTTHRTTYKVKNANTGGKIKVSAPVGSNEAEFFDAIAAANSTPKRTDNSRSAKNESSLVMRHSGDERRRGRGWFWS